MRSIRPATFETNSSSCHCLVICSQEEWEKFIQASLFVEMAEYKGGREHALVTLDRICEQIKQSFTEDNIRFHLEKQIPPRELVEWIYAGFTKDMLDPGEEPRYGGLVFRQPSDPWWMEHIPDSLKGYISERPDALDDLTDWVALTETPFSYEMMRVLSNNFMMTYDDYNSFPPHLVDDIRHFCVLGVDVPLPAVECRAIWYA